MTETKVDNVMLTQLANQTKSNEFKLLRMTLDNPFDLHDVIGWSMERLLIV